MSSDTRWTRERIEAALEGAQLTGAVNRTYLTIIDDLLADRDLLLAERDQPASTYRLPDWLGGHKLVYVHPIEDSPDASIGVEPPTDEDPGRVIPMTVPHQWLVEVRPPSIEDPLDLPVEIDEDEADRCLYLDGYDARRVELRLRQREEHLTDRRGMYVTASIRLTADDLLRLAQAAGTRYRAITAYTDEPVSGPIGIRVSRPGPVAVQQPGGGAS